MVPYGATQLSVPVVSPPTVPLLRLPRVLPRPKQHQSLWVQPLSTRGETSDGVTDFSFHVTNFFLDVRAAVEEEGEGE